MARNVNYQRLHASDQNHLQAVMKRLQQAEFWRARGEAAREIVKHEYYDWLDDNVGPDTYVIYEGRGDLEFKRMTREIQEPRTFDVEFLRRNLPADQFALITKTVVDVNALDLARRARQVDTATVEAATSYGTRANLIFSATGARSRYKPFPGSLAIVDTPHLIVAREG